MPFAWLKYDQTLISEQNILIYLHSFLSDKWFIIMYQRVFEQIKEYESLSHICEIVMVPNADNCTNHDLNLYYLSYWHNNNTLNSRRILTSRPSSSR